MTKVGALIERDGFLLAPGVYDALSAIIAREAGFEALFVSGYSIAASSLGVPDVGILTQTEVIDAARRICRVVDCPVIVDADTGYGGVVNVARTVTELIEAGARGCFLEDQVWPKKCGHMQGKRVIPMEEHVEKLAAACRARGDADFFIVARTDARKATSESLDGQGGEMQGSLEEAIRRARAYKKTGVDALFIEAPQSVDELKEISRQLPPPFVANMLEGGLTPMLTGDELRELGFKIAVFPLTGLFAAAGAQREVFRHLRRTGTTRDVAGKLLAFPEMNQLLNLDKYYELDKKHRERLI